MVNVVLRDGKCFLSADVRRTTSGNRFYFVRATVNLEKTDIARL